MFSIQISKPHIFLIAWFFAAIFFGNASASLAADAAKPKEVSVLHMSSNFLGNVTFTLGDAATSIYMEKLGIEAFGGGDKMSQILIMNHRDKTFLQEPRSEWAKRAAKYKAKTKKDPFHKGYKLSKGSKAKVCGLNCTFYEVKAIKLDGSLEEQSNKKQIWLCDALQNSKGVSKQFAMEILRVFAQMEELPASLDGVLVRLKVDKGHKMVNMLDTYKVEKVKKAVELKVPKGYHRVKDEVALLWGDESSSADMFGSP